MITRIDLRGDHRAERRDHRKTEVKTPVIEFFILVPRRRYEKRERGGIGANFFGTS